GFTEDFYICTVCDCPCTADGQDPEWSEPTGSHTPGTELFPADYIPCIGGFTEDFYRCVDCGWEVDANGNELQWVKG
ncbi:hypothetical protein QIG69_27205, partial [Klebsiella pneumoniae]|nr:hypothetical protein [Klebsiella pneumoniae]